MVRAKRRERREAEDRQAFVSGVLDRARDPEAFAPTHAEVLARAAAAMADEDRPRRPVTNGSLWAFYR